MKAVLCLICVIAFLATGFTSVAHVSNPWIPSSHHNADIVKSTQMSMHDQTHHDTDIETCQDCCCLHIHVLAGSLTEVSLYQDLKDKRVFAIQTALRSQNLSPSYRPPIA